MTGSFSPASKKKREFSNDNDDDDPPNKNKNNSSDDDDNDHETTIRIEKFPRDLLVRMVSWLSATDAVALQNSCRSLRSAVALLRVSMSTPLSSSSSSSSSSLSSGFIEIGAVEHSGHGRRKMYAYFCGAVAGLHSARLSFDYHNPGWWNGTGTVLFTEYGIDDDGGRVAVVIASRPIANDREGRCGIDFRPKPGFIYGL